MSSMSISISSISCNISIIISSCCCCCMSSSNSVSKRERVAYLVQPVDREAAVRPREPFHRRMRVGGHADEVVVRIFG